jgi:hypothetical protein
MGNWANGNVGAVGGISAVFVHCMRYLETPSQHLLKTDDSVVPPGFTAIAPQKTPKKFPLTGPPDIFIFSAVILGTHKHRLLMSNFNLLQDNK